MPACFTRTFLLVPLCFSLLHCGGSGGGSPAPLPATCGEGAQAAGLVPVSGAALDLADMGADDGLFRLCGSAGSGSQGTPVTGGHDVDGDGFADLALSAMLASPRGGTLSSATRPLAGQVYLHFGRGSLDYTRDSADDAAGDVLTIIGEGPQEMTGSEIWMGDVDGDGLGDLLIARQNHSYDGRIGSGALTVIFGSSALRNTISLNNGLLDLGARPEGLAMFDIYGAAALDRLGIWVRVGDITGDGIDDIAVGADQADGQGSDSGTVYVIRGGSHLRMQALDLATLASSALAPHVATLLPPADSANYHFGATVVVADLDDNDRAEVLVATALNRSGASIPPAGSNVAESSGGFPGGRVFIFWDDNFPEDWGTGLTLVADDNLSGGLSDIRGGTTASYSTRYFGEEMLGGRDYDGDGRRDLFVGDITGSPFGTTAAGLGFVFLDAATLKNRSFAINNRPLDVTFTTLLGVGAGTISSDTALDGDFDGDGIDDLIVASPHASPSGRQWAGALHVLWGQSVWPEVINLLPSAQPAQEEFAITNVWGAQGSRSGDVGDTLGYSADSGDIDGDGLEDAIVNEMVGNGVGAGAIDAGNLIVISGATLAQFK